jgi:hypothetical protein
VAATRAGNGLLAARAGDDTLTGFREKSNTPRPPHPRASRDPASPGGGATPRRTIEIFFK